MKTRVLTFEADSPESDQLVERFHEMAWGPITTWEGRWRVVRCERYQRCGTWYNDFHLEQEETLAGVLRS